VPHRRVALPRAMRPLALLAALLALAAAPARGDAPGSEQHAPGEGGDDAAAAPPAREPTMHTVFSAECTPYFDWQSLALVRSHKLVRRGAQRGAAGGPGARGPVLGRSRAERRGRRAAGGYARPDHAPAGQQRRPAGKVRRGARRGAAERARSHRAPFRHRALRRARPRRAALAAAALRTHAHTLARAQRAAPQVPRRAPGMCCQRV
jgi:hypothetical protein